MPVKSNLDRCSLLLLAVVSVGLAGCTSSSPPRAEYEQFTPGKTTRKEAISMLGRPDWELELPRLAVPQNAAVACMRWDQRTLPTLIYEDEYTNSTRTGMLQELQVYLAPDGTVCGTGKWERMRHAVKWGYDLRN